MAPAAKNAKENLNYKEINGKPIRIMWAQRNPNARKNKDGNIFIKARDPSSPSLAPSSPAPTLRR